VKIRRAEKLLGAIGESSRIKILLLLSKREMCVCELESALGLPQPTVSHHLSLLEQADLVQRSKKERWVFYKVRDSPVLDLLRGLIS
jgi:ArsR family transcriptional regulator